MSNIILLSICIPTYNRASYLNLCLKRVIEQVTIDMPVEIIVSDNFSTDNTIEVASKYLHLPFFRLIKQPYNKGPMRNGLELVNEHAKGLFCWYIGDDDYVVSGAINNLINLIKLNNCDFIFLNLQSVNADVDFNNFNLNPNPNFELLSSFNQLLLPKYSQIFVGELMASVFKRDLFLREKEVYNRIDKEYLSTLETSYLHCVIFANQFVGKPALYVNDIMVLADSRAREWSDKSAYLVVEQLFNLLLLYKNNGLERNILNKCYSHFIELSIGGFFKFLFNLRLNYRDRISFRRYIFFLFKHPVMTLQAINNIIKKKYLKINKLSFL